MKSSINLFSTWRLAVLLTALLFVGLAQAQMRVLIKFDPTEHIIHRLIEVESVNPAFAAEPSAQSDIRLNPGKAAVHWLATDGTILHSESMDDPRLTHAPLAGANASHTMVSLSSGAYMVSGPSRSALLEVHLPENSALALEAQVWQFQLIP